MATNYDKYINSTGTHYISNSGSDENGKAHGGKAGDQTGREWQIKSWYNRPWNCVLRYPDQSVAMMIAQFGIDAAMNNKIGYDQYQRTTYWNALKAAGYKPSAVATACEADCTAGVTANVKAVGHLLGIPALENIPTDTYSGNMRSRFKAAGFQVLTASKFLTGYNYLLPGDILLYEGHHAATNLTKGKYATWPNAAPAKPAELGDRTLKNGSEGADVKELQTLLILLGYDCGHWGADGEFGDCTELAVEKFQKDHGLKVTGIADKETIDRIRLAMKEDPDVPRYVQIVGGDCYVRSAPNTGGRKLGVAYAGTEWLYGGQTAENGWLLIEYKNENGWVSGKYGRLMG